MKLFVLLSAVVLSLTSCGNNPGNNMESGDVKDSVSTDSLKDPSYNPAVEADSAAKDMNLDSADLKDSGRTR